MKSRKYKKTCKYLNNIKHLLILASAGTGRYCALISEFASLVSVPVGFRSSAIGLKICAITAGIKRYKSVIKKKKKHDKTVFLGKSRFYWSSNLWDFNWLIY